MTLYECVPLEEMQNISYNCYHLDNRSEMGVSESYMDSYTVYLRNAVVERKYSEVISPWRVSGESIVH